MTVRATSNKPFTTANRLANIQPSSTLAITAKAKALRAQGKPVLSLAAGEPDFETPLEVCRAIKSSIDSGYTKYTPTSGAKDLKEAVVQKIKRDQGLDIAIENVAISCGAKHSLYNILQAIVNPGDDVIVPSPYWVSYPEMVKLACANPIFLNTAADKYVLTRDAIEKTITPKTRVILLNSPSNPTGAVIPKEELIKIAQLAREKELIVISDEIYEYFVFDGIKHISITQLMEDWMDYAVLVNGVSKSHSMTGLRIGYTVAHPDLIKKIGILQDHSTSNPTSSSQKGAIAALSMGSEFNSETKTKFESKRNQMMDLVKQIPELEITVPQGAFYAFVSVQGAGLSPAEFCKRLLEEKFVATIPGEGFGSTTGVRMSFAAASETISEAFVRIREFIASLK